MYGNFTAQAGIISSNIISSPNIIKSTLTWDFNNVLVMDFNPYGNQNINDRPRINVWRDVNGTPDFNYLIYASGGKNVLSPAPSGKLIQPWGDRDTGIYKFPDIGLDNSLLINFRQKLTGNSTNDRFANVASNLDGSVLVIGAPYDDRGGFDVGTVFVYTGNITNGWSIRQELTGIEADRKYGNVDINANSSVIIIGGETANNSLVYTGNPTDGWQLKQILTGNYTTGPTRVTTNASGTILIMGMMNDGNNSTSEKTGSMFIFTGNSTIGWTLKQKIWGDGPGLNPGDYFGLSVATNASGTVLMMGGPRDSQASTFAGAVLVYTGNATDGWNLKQKLLGERVNGYFGTSIDMNNDGSILVIGAPQDLGGAVIMYTGNSVAGWGRQQKFINDLNLVNRFGSSVAINESGTVLIIGNPFDNNVGDPPGSTFVYINDNINGWQLKQKLIGNSSNDAFGSSVATNGEGNILMVGSPFDDDNSLNAGAVSIYTTRQNIIAGVDLFTHTFATPINLSPPLNEWSIEPSAPGELKYQYKFKVGEKTPQINIELDYNPICISNGSTTLPTCSLFEILVFDGTSFDGCPIFLCKDLEKYNELGSLYTTNTWTGNGLAGFGTWNYISGTGTFRTIGNSNQLDRQSIGDQAFFVVGNTGSVERTHTVEYNLNRPFVKDNSLSVDVNYAWNGGARSVMFKGANNSNYQHNFVHSGNDELKYFRNTGVGITAINNLTITGNVYQKAITYKIYHLGTGVLVQAYPYQSTGAIIYSDLVGSNNINWNTYITGLSFSANLSNSSNIDWFNYGMYFNNIEYDNNFNKEQEEENLINIITGIPYLFKQKLIGTNPLNLDFGYSLAISPDCSTIVIGDPYAFVGDNQGGAIHIYTGNENDGWSFHQNIISNIPTGEFGHSVDINNNQNIIVGAPGNPSFGIEPNVPGRAYFYKKNTSTNLWELANIQIASDPNSLFGHVVCINEDNFAAVGAFRENNYASGAVYIYSQSPGSTEWSFAQRLTGIGLCDPQRLFGFNVQMDASADTIIVSQPFCSNGYVHIYTGNRLSENITRNSLWGFKQSIEGPDLGRFGTSLAIDNNGNTIVFGGPYPYGFGGDQQGGSIQIYTGNYFNGWDFKQRITGGNYGNAYGTSTTISNNIITMGGPRDLSDRGAVNVYFGNPNVGWSLSQQITGSGNVYRFGTVCTTNKGYDGGKVLVISDDDTIQRSVQIYVLQSRKITLKKSTISAIDACLNNILINAYIKCNNNDCLRDINTPVFANSSLTIPLDDGFYSYFDSTILPSPGGVRRRWIQVTNGVVVSTNRCGVYN